MSGTPRQRPGGMPLPELDLDDHERSAMRPGMSGRNQGPPASGAHPARAAAAVLPVAALELDMPSAQGSALTFWSPVRGVSCGRTAPESELSQSEKSQAAKIGDFEPVPEAFWRWGIYAFHVLSRKRELASETRALRGSAEQAYAAYEAAVVAIGERARAFGRGSAKASDSAGPRSASGQGAAAQGDERVAIEFAFKALEDAKTYGREFDAQRNEVRGLFGIAEKRRRAVLIHEFAASTNDDRAFKVGLASYVGAGTFFLLFVFSPVLWRLISPPELPPLPPEAATVIDAKKR